MSGRGTAPPARPGQRRALAGAAGLAVLLAGVIAWGFARGHHHRAYDAIFLAVVAARVAGDAPSDADAAWRLHHFVNLNVRTPVRAPVLDTARGQVLLRGFGYCDQSVWLLIGLLESRGISGRMTWLQRVDGISPHTVAEILLAGQWRVFDTHYGWVPRRPDGRLVSAGELAAEPGLLGPSRARAEWYRHAQVSLRGGPDWLERGAPLAARLRVRALTTLVALTPAWLIDRLQDLYLRLPLRPDPDRRFAAESPERRLFVQARHYHMLLRTAAAERAYVEWLRRYPAHAAADDVLHALAGLRLTQGRAPAAAAADFDALLARYPESDWRREALYLAGLAHERAGACPTAAQRYRAAVAAGAGNGIEDAHLRLASLPCA